MVLERAISFFFLPDFFPPIMIRQENFLGYFLFRCPLIFTSPMRRSDIWNNNAVLKSVRHNDTPQFVFVFLHIYLPINTEYHRKMEASGNEK